MIPQTLIVKESRKTRKGWIGKKIKQIHLRQDISCGFELCPEHGHISPTFIHERLSQDPLYFISTPTIINQTDIIMNCVQIKNLVLLQSSLEALRKYDINKYNRFKNYLDLHFDSEDKVRYIYVFPDNYHKVIAQSNLDDRVKSCMIWYREHLKEVVRCNAPVMLLTMEQNEVGEGIVPLIEFLKVNNPMLLDYVGYNFPCSMEQENIFEEHVPLESAIKGMREGRYFEAKFMEEKSYFKIGKEMFKLALTNNRAIFGDVVIIQLDNPDTWSYRGIKTITEQENVEEQGNQIISQTHEGSKLFQLLKSKEGVIAKGKVVCIWKRNSKDFCGSVEESADSVVGDGWNIVQFKPVDDKFPSFYLRTYNLAGLRGKRIVVALDEWPINSKYPMGHFRKVLGDIGDPKVEGDVILLEHNVQIKQFSKKAYDCLPEAGEKFTIPPTEEAYRLDLRHIDVVSIDPPGCKDIDDALHCVPLGNGNLEIGVHIADVSYYVRPDSALDIEARNRCTTVYLVDRRTDMLPKLLTENLCSLRADVDRLAFSVIWEVDGDANIIRTKYCKSIIRSRNAFTYQQAQDLMHSDSTSNIAESVRNLNKVAKLLKKKRISKGALTLASTQVKFSMEEETHSTTDVELYQLLETNQLIEQFMLLANISVAEKIYSRFPALSILRRHTPPKPAELEILKEILSKYGYSLNYDTSKALADSLDQVDRPDDKFFNKLIRILTTRCMNEATYFCSADFDSKEFYHYGLAAEFYTHFTSPIRRYADVLVHRLLSAAIDLEPLPHFMVNKLKMTKVCEKMNMRNRMARYASRASSDYHIYKFFKEKGDNVQQGIIVSIRENSVKIMLIKYGLECLVDFSMEETQKTIKLNQNQGVFMKCLLRGKERNLFENVRVKVSVEMQGFHKKTIITLV